MKIKITLLVILISQISNTLKAQVQDTTGRQLKEVTITESKGYQTKYLSESSRITGKIFEIPQNIVVVSQRLIQGQQAFTPTDLSRNVSGVNSIFPFPGVYTDFNIRGTRATQGKFRNGMNMGNSIFGMLQEDMSYTESVEFIKGPAPYLLGQGEPGGLFNVVTKKPTKETIRNINLSGGSFNLFRVHGDISGGVGKAK